MKHLFIILAATAVFFVSCMKIDHIDSVEPVTNGQEESYDAWTLVDLSYLDKHAIGPVSKVNAGFGGTKATLDMNAAGTHASIVFSPGDVFKMQDNEYFVATYTTAEGGAEATFTSSESLSGNEFHCIFPGYKSWTKYNGHMVYGITIPTVQEAVAGSVKDGYYRGYGYTDSQDSNIYFYNALSVLRFRMTGSAVSTISSVRLKGVNPIAGDCAMMIDDGHPVISFDISFGSDTPSRSVSLNGPFEANKDYYIVLAPGDQPFVTLSFSDADGNEEVKTSTKAIRFSSSTITDFGTIDLGSEITPPEDVEEPLKYMEATSGLTPVTMVVVPEGFTEGQLGDYEILAKSAIDFLFTVEPYNSYREYFNVWILKVASEESGANITDGSGNITTTRNCYFGSQWGGDKYTDMKADSNKLFAFVEDNCPDIMDGSHTLEEVAIAMIINDERYAGICWSYGSGRGYAMAPYSLSGGPLTWAYPSMSAVSEQDPSEGTQTTPKSILDEVGSTRGDWRNTFVHEFGGHCFGRLLDEYWYTDDKGPGDIPSQSWAVPFGLNISSSFDNPLWQTELLDRLDALVIHNPLYSRVGIFQGADVSILNRWRSERVSCMIDNRCYFSAWQRMLIVKRIMSLAGGTFDWNSFIIQDRPEDPSRDVAGNLTMNNALSLIPPHPVPLLPPPVLVERP